MNETTNSNLKADAHDTEIARIQAEYQRRERELEPDLYGWNRPVNLFFHCETLRPCIRALVRENMFPLDGRVVVDVGCGRGLWLAEFLQWGAEAANLCGIDLDEDRIRTARKRIRSGDLQTGDACRLPWTGGTFDLATQFTLFTSILEPAVKRQIASEMVRVLKPGGLILWYDFRFNNPGNPSVRGIKANEIGNLFEGCRIRLETVTLAPPLARRIVPVSWIASLLLEKVPFLRTHYLGIIRKPR